MDFFTKVADSFTHNTRNLVGLNVDLMTWTMAPPNAWNLAGSGYISC